MANKIILNCMVRNETAHVASAMAHFTSLFDEINVVDHRSEDGTLEAINAWRNEACKINSFSFDNTGYFQSEVMSFLAQSQIRAGDTDWVFFLDFDEYLPFRSREEFEQALVQHKFHPVIKMRWHNLIPTTYGISKHLGSDFLVAAEASEYVKIAIQPKLLRHHPEIQIDQGNHAAKTSVDGQHLDAEFGFGVFHIPIDGIDHLQKKIATGLAAYEGQWNKGDTELGRHWRLMDKALKGGADQQALLNSFIAHYGEDDALESIIENGSGLLSTEDLYEKLYRKLTLNVAGVDVASPQGRPSQDIQSPIVLSLNDEGMVECMPPIVPPPAQESYKPTNGIKAAALPATNELLSGLSSTADLDAFLGRSVHKIDVFTPTAWGGHIPFMFALIETLRPRRFVELGSHYGASFFAACQTIKRLNLPSCGIAIDLWEGDPQAGFYGEEVYNSFEGLRTKNFSDQSRSIRSYFIDAAPNFEEKSLDLIHIDGLHTFEAVQEDYETWRPKLTDNGVIIFHDTNEYQTGFGVWDFFAQIRNEATASFEFKHTHGLGVMAFGDVTKNPMISVLNMMNADPMKAELHFARQGELAEIEALFAFSKARSSGDSRRIGQHHISDADLLGTRTKVLINLILTRFKLRRKRKMAQKAQAEE